MPRLNLKPSHKPIRGYYATLQQYDQHNATHEGAVSNSFAFLLDTCAKQLNATLIPQYGMHTPKGNRIVIDGVILWQSGRSQTVVFSNTENSVNQVVRIIEDVSN